MIPPNALCSPCASRGRSSVRQDGPVRDHGSFDTSTRGSLALSQWLSEHGCTHIALEATGVYWKPVWHVLEGAFARGSTSLDAVGVHTEVVPAPPWNIKVTTPEDWALAQGIAAGRLAAEGLP